MIMKDWFGKLQQREQQFVLAGGAALGLFLLYILLWSPFSSSIDTLHKSVLSQEQTLQWMKSAAGEIHSQGPVNAKVPAGNRSLLTLVSQTSKTSGLGTSVKRVEEDGQNKARVWLEQTDFDKFILWLGSLRSNHGITASQVTVDSQSGNDLVNIRLVLNK